MGRLIVRSVLVGCLVRGSVCRESSASEDGNGEMMETESEQGVLPLSSASSSSALPAVPVAKIATASLLVHPSRKAFRLLGERPQGSTCSDDCRGRLWMVLCLVGVLFLAPGFVCRWYQMRYPPQKKSKRETDGTQAMIDDGSANAEREEESQADYLGDAGHATLLNVDALLLGQLSTLDRQTPQERETASSAGESPFRKGVPVVVPPGPVAEKCLSDEPSPGQIGLPAFSALSLKVPSERLELATIPQARGQVPCEVKLKSSADALLREIAVENMAQTNAPTMPTLTRLGRSGSDLRELDVQGHICGLSCGSRTCWVGSLGAAMSCGPRV